MLGDHVETPAIDPYVPKSLVVLEVELGPNASSFLLDPKSPYLSRDHCGDNDLGHRDDLKNAQLGY